MIGIGLCQQVKIHGLQFISVLPSWPHTCDDAEMFDVGAHANEPNNVFMTKLPKEPIQRKIRVQVSMACP